MPGRIADRFLASYVDGMRAALPPTEPDAGGHDIIVIGGSAGALESLLEIAVELPADLPASVFVVIHTHPEGRTRIAEVLTRRSRLSAKLAVHGEPLERGKIYIAPPDNHLMLRPGYMTVYRGPKENGHRPALDPLFRSAAMHYGARVVGVVLSGYQDCGTAGLMSIKARGGVTIVQAPDDATVPDMPRNAAARVGVDHVQTAREIGTSIIRLANEPPLRPIQPVPEGIHGIEGDQLGQAFDVVCPLCAGTLTESQFQGLSRYRCHVGHAFSDSALVREQAESLERALWAAARALEESARLARRMAQSSAGNIRDRFVEKAESQDQQAQLVMGILAGRGLLSKQDSIPVEPAAAAEPDLEPTND